MKKILIAISLIILCFSPLFAGEQAQKYYVLTVKGIIDSPTADYIIKGIASAETEGAAGVLIEIDTPGGLFKSTRSIIEKILASKIPVITYVTPKGGHAASAGTFILMASHVAAMAEGTNIGTASPIDMKGNKSDEKITNDSITYIKNLARMRERSQQWAEDAIVKNVSSSEIEAKEKKVIEYIAKDKEDLFKQLDGKKIKVAETTVTISGKNPVFTPVEFPPRHKFLHALTDPNIAYVLFLVGIYGLIYELAHPGVLFPGVAGAICLVLAFIGFDAMPISVAGIILIILAIILFIAEAFTPTFGALMLGGTVSLIIGSVLLFPGRSAGSAWAPSYWVIGVMVLLTILIVGVILSMIIKALRKKTITGVQTLVGVKGTAVSDVFQSGVVNVGGEEWQAYSDEQIKARDLVEVLEVNGMKVKVKKIERKKEA